MKFKYMFFLAFLSFGLMGCMSNPSTTASTADDEAVSSKTVAATNDSRADQAGDGVVCRLEQPIGSHRSRKVCRTQEQIDAEMRRSQGGMMRGSRTGSAGGGGDGQ